MPDNTDLLFALGRSILILAVGFACAHWVFKRCRERVWIWWTVLVASILSFFPIPSRTIAIPKPLELSVPKVYDAGMDYRNTVPMDAIVPAWPYAVAALLGVGLALFGFRMYITWRLLRESEQIASPEILSEVADIGAAVGLREMPIVKTSDKADSAYAAGLLNPVIVLPARMMVETSAEERRAILCHEMLHIRRKDHWFVAVFDLWLCLSFWNPMAWLGRNAAYNSMEEANDERTVGTGLVSRAAYLKALINGNHPMVAMPIARFHGQSNLRRRIHQIAEAKPRQASPLLVPACVAILALAYPIRVESMPFVPGDSGELGPDELIFSSSVDKVTPRAYRMRMDGSGLRPLMPSQHATGQTVISPDGTKVAFITGKDDHFDIYMSNVDGSKKHPVAVLPGSDMQPHFSPDGKKILYTSRRDEIWQIYVYDLESRKTTRLSDPKVRELEAKWHPTGERIIFSSYMSGKEKVWSMNLDGSDRVQITHDERVNSGPTYSRDGRYAIYMGTSGGGWDLFRMDLATGIQLQLTDTIGDDGEANVSPDNMWIYFVTGRRGRPEIARMKLDGTNERIIGPIEGGWPKSRRISAAFLPVR